MSPNSWFPVYRFETIDLGTYRGDDYFLTGFVNPEPATCDAYVPDEDADEYGVSLARSTPHGSNVEIVRMDTSHGRPHLDRVDLSPIGEKDRKVWLEQGYAYERMKGYLLSNWTTFVDRYIRHTG